MTRWAIRAIPGQRQGLTKLTAANVLPLPEDTTVAEVCACVAAATASHSSDAPADQRRLTSARRARADLPGDDAAMAAPASARVHAEVAELVILDDSVTAHR